MKLIVDTDIGDDIDDAFAIRFLDECKEIELLGITTVYKNVSQRAKIAKKLTNRQYPVHAGENKPLKKDVRLLTGEKIEENGLINIDHFSEAAKNEDYDGDDGVDFILSQLKKYPNEVSILAIGPLTNLAKAASKDTKAFSLIKNLVVMGGRFKEAVPEWNVETDPEAARIVFGSGVNTVLVPYDVTSLCGMSQEDVSAIRRADGEKNEYLASMMNRWIEHYDPNWEEREKLPVLHDVLAAEILIDKSICEYENLSFSCPENGELCDCTVFSEQGNFRMKIATGIHKEKYDRLLYRRLKIEKRA